MPSYKGLKEAVWTQIPRVANFGQLKSTAVASGWLCALKRSFAIIRIHTIWSVIPKIEHGGTNDWTENVLCRHIPGDVSGSDYPNREGAGRFLLEKELWQGSRHDSC